MSHPDGESVLVGELRTRLAYLAPPMLDPGGPQLRSEHPYGGDLVVPHRYARGLAIAVSFGEAQASIYWVQYRNLRRSDDFDEAISCPEAVFSRSRQGSNWTRAVSDGISNELTRPFDLVLTYSERAARHIQVSALLSDVSGEAKARQVWTRRLRRGTAVGTLPRQDLTVSTSFMTHDDDFPVSLKRALTQA